MIARMLMAGAVIAACSSGDRREDREPVLAMTGCADIVAYGAVPNNPAFDNTSAILAAITDVLTGPLTSNPEFHRAVCIPEGEFFVHRPSPASTIASFDLAGASGLMFIGAGPGSVITMLGPDEGHCVTRDNGALYPWSLFRLRNGTSGTTFRSLTLRGAGMATYNEHSFLIQIGHSGAVNTAGVSDVVIDGVHFERPCGDAIYLSGGDQITTTFEVRRVRILDSTFLGANRRAITPNYGALDVVITGNSFIANNGAINFDNTINVSGFVISRNLFLNAESESSPHIQIAGHPMGPEGFDIARDITISDNVLLGGGILAGRAHDLVLNGNLIVGSTVPGEDGGPQVYSEIDVYNNVARISIVGNTVLRRSSYPAPPIAVFDRGGVPPTRIIVRSNRVHQPAFTCEVEGACSDFVAAIRGWATDINITDNLVTSEGSSTSPSLSAGIDVTAKAFDVQSALVSGNQITGVGGTPLNSGIYANARNHTLSGLSLTENTIAGATNAIRFNKGTGTVELPLVAMNRLDGATTAIAGVPSIVAAYTEGRDTGTLDLVGSGTPAIAAPDGSTYVNLAGGLGTTLYVRAGGAWVAK